MLAHLTRKRLVRGNAKTGILEYQETLLRWSGLDASGDELEGPVCMVIDIGRTFTTTHDGRLYLTGAGQVQFKTFTPATLVQAARMGYYGFTLLWDEMDDEIGG